MTQIKTLILCLFLLSLCSMTYGQESKKNNDSVETKKTVLKSNFSSRKAAIVKNEEYKSINKQKANSNLTRKRYLLKNDSINLKVNSKSSRSSIKKRSHNSSDSLSRIQIMNKLKKQNKKTINKTDSLSKKQIIKKQ